MTQGEGGGPSADTESLILALLSEGRKTVAELVEKTGKSLPSVKSCLKRLKSKGKIANVKYGLYRTHGPAVAPPREEDEPLEPEGTLGLRLEKALRFLERGPRRLSEIKRELGLSTGKAQNLLRRMRSAKLVEMTGDKSTAMWQLPGYRPQTVSTARPKFDKQEPARHEVAFLAAPSTVVTALLAQRERVVRDLDRIDRMLVIAREEG